MRKGVTGSQNRPTSSHNIRTGKVGILVWKNMKSQRMRLCNTAKLNLMELSLKRAPANSVPMGISS